MKLQNALAWLGNLVVRVANWYVKSKLDIPADGGGDVLPPWPPPSRAEEEYKKAQEAAKPDHIIFNKWRW